MKSRFLQFLTLATVIMACISCSDINLTPKAKLDQPDLTAEETRRLILLDTSFVYPVENAEKEAMQVAAELDSDDEKRGIKSRRVIASISKYSILDTIYHARVKSQQPDPGFYVFNFDGEKGFTIISGDKRVQGRLAWSGEGKIDNNPHAGLRIFLSRLIPYFQFKRLEVESMRGDSAHVSLLYKISKFRKSKESNQKNGRTSVPCPQLRTSALPCDQGCALYTSYSIISSTSFTNTIVAPLLKTNWSQYAPYNNLYASGCGYVNTGCFANSNYLAGCVPISEAQVVAYFYAQRYGGDWAAIANNPSSCYNSTQAWMVSALVKGIYDHYALTAKNCSSGTFTFNREIWFLNGDRGIHPDFGLVQGDWRDYNVGDLRASIMNGSPVPVSGSEHEWCLFFNWGCVPDPTVMHQWVLDGILTTNNSTTYVINPVDYDACERLPSYTFTGTSVVNYYTHNNWGWGGSTNANTSGSTFGKNGWYLESAFGDWNINGTDNVYSFNHDDKIIAYITQY